jgi:protein tyrosine/serine phosphatase
MRESVHLFGLPGLVNVGRVNEWVYRGADPEPIEGYKSLAGLGVKTVPNLSTERDVEAYGITEIYKPMRFFRDVDPSMVYNLVTLLCHTKLLPIYVHCAQGRDRTGMVIACFRIEGGWSTEDAIAEMDSFGFHYVWTHFLEFVQGYKSRKEGG